MQDCQLLMEMETSIVLAHLGLEFPCWKAVNEASGVFVPGQSQARETLPGRGQHYLDIKTGRQHLQEKIRALNPRVSGII